MRFQRSSLQRFHAWRAGRIALPVGFLAVLMAGSYLIADPMGHESSEPVVVRQERVHYDPYHPDGGYDVGGLDQAGMQGIARQITSTAPADQSAVAKRDTRPVPTLVRAIEPSAVYKPPVAGHAKAEPAVVNSEAAAQENLTYPVGVERFDQCKDRCDTRDPFLTPITYPMASASAEPEPASPGLFRGGLIHGAVQMFDRTVESAAAGTGAAYDAVKHTVSGAIDLIR